ncbi:hypothetical protein MKS88_002633 [Plasmodium brasilianum]|uniref:Uncharacterized protein n=1 Tax=Plasmodium brasilianum TaxID=5824 RepID=A0ACB9Y850_PLABR|nr:hypothetical protein MKS88_002633 [Plasmodium brasilianum]
MKGNIISLIFTKIFAFIFFICIYLYNNDMNTCDKLLIKKDKLSGHLYLRTNRLLSNDSLDSILNKYISRNKNNNKLLNEEELSLYSTDTISESEDFKERLSYTEEVDKVAKKKKPTSLNSVDTFLERKLFNIEDSAYKIRNKTSINRNIENLSKVLDPS